MLGSFLGLGITAVDLQTTAGEDVSAVAATSSFPLGPLCNTGLGAADF